MIQKFEVPVEKLTWHCDSSQFDFTCTADLAPLREFIGQERARKAMEFGLNMVNDGYNIYMSGISGTGKTSMVKTQIEKLIKEREARGEKFVLDDWCYVYNFKEPDRPQIIRFAQGQGKVFRDRIAELLTSVSRAVWEKPSPAMSIKNKQKRRWKSARLKNSRP